MVDSNRKNKSTPKIPIFEQYLETENHAKQLEKHDANQLIALMKKTITGHENINKTMRQQIYTLDTLKGYDSLGYDSLYDCLKNTLNDKKKISAYYRQAKAARVEANVSPTSPIGEIPESILREVGKLKSPKHQRIAWNKSIKMRKEGKKYPIASVVLNIVKIEHLKNNAELADPRVAKNWAVSAEEKLEKLMVRFTHEFKLQTANLNKKEKLNCWWMVLENIEKMQKDLSMPSFIEFVLGPPGEIPELNFNCFEDSYISG